MGTSCWVICILKIISGGKDVQFTRVSGGRAQAGRKGATVTHANRWSNAKTMLTIRRYLLLLLLRIAQVMYHFCHLKFSQFLPFCLSFFLESLHQSPILRLIKTLFAIVDQVVVVVFIQFCIDSSFIIHWLNIGFRWVVMIWSKSQKNELGGRKRWIVIIDTGLVPIMIIVDDLLRVGIL